MDRELQERIETEDNRRRKNVDADSDESMRPFYESGKLRPDPAAIANLAALPLPKAPPGRVPPVIVNDETGETKIEES